MRLVYLCVANVPPDSDFHAVLDFFKDIPECLRPRDRDHETPHFLYFADRVGNEWLPEFHDFAIAFISETFLADGKALQCLSRAYAAFPNLVCIDLRGNLSKKSMDIARQYSKCILSLDQGKEFLLKTFPEIQATYDMEEKKLTESIENEGYQYLNQTIEDLKKREKRNRILGWLCYGGAFFALLAMLGFAFTRFTLIIDNESGFEIDTIVVLCVGITILSAIIVSLTRFMFMLGKSLMVEAIRNADRAHAIGLGKLYLQLYKSNFKWDELKDVLKNWNIDSGSAFKDLDAKDIEPVSLDKMITSIKH